MVIEAAVKRPAHDLLATESLQGSLLMPLVSHFTISVTLLVATSEETPS